MPWRQPCQNFSYAGTKIKAGCEHGNIHHLHQWETTEQQAIEKYLQALTWDECRPQKQTSCLCRDTGGKGTLLAQCTSFNTLDNWGRKIPSQSKRERTAGKKRLKGHTLDTHNALHSDTFFFFWILFGVIWNGVRLRPLLVWLTKEQ